MVARAHGAGLRKQRFLWRSWLVATASLSLGGDPWRNGHDHAIYELRPRAERSCAKRPRLKRGTCADVVVIGVCLGVSDAHSYKFLQFSNYVMGAPTGIWVVGPWCPISALF